MTDPGEEHTFSTKFRIPKRMWEAYGRVVGDRERGADLLNHVRAVIAERGDDKARAELAAAEEELVARRARKGGRPPKGNAIPPTAKES